MSNIGFVGLGIMGKPMAKNLLKAGFGITFYARRPEVVDEMKALGAKAVDSAMAVARATDIIITIVTADPEVREVILGENGVLEGASEGDLIVDMSTISPLTIREIAAHAGEKGVQVMDAPVSGGDTGAIAGTLTIIAGGRAEDFNRCRDIFSAMGTEENIFHVGDVGVGQTVKIVNQLIGGINMAAISEALVLGIKAGADPDVMRQVVGVSSGNSNLFQARVADFLLKDSYEPGFMLDLMKKDMGIAVDLGKALDVPLPLGAGAYQMYAAASCLGAGYLDFSAVSRAVEQMSGVKIGKPRI
jgi:3-hydroxyisobutyrate dehydrogenase